MNVMMWLIVRLCVKCRFETLSFL